MKEKMYKYNNLLIKITYTLNDDQNTITLDHNNSIDFLLNYIANSHKLKVGDLEILFNNKKLSVIEYQKRLRDIVEPNNNNPNFNVRVKDESFAYHHVTIEGFPSRPELYGLLYIYLNESRGSTNYKDEHKDNWVKFSFFEYVSI
jgi:hypothetical protein